MPCCTRAAAGRPSMRRPRRRASTDAASRPTSARPRARRPRRRSSRAPMRPPPSSTRTTTWPSPASGSHSGAASRCRATCRSQASTTPNSADTCTLHSRASRPTPVPGARSRRARSSTPSAARSLCASTSPHRPSPCATPPDPRRTIRAAEPPRTRSTTMRRRILTLAAVAAGALTLSACAGGGGNAGQGMDSHGDITIWYSNNEAEISWGKQMVEAWNADHPKEKIKAQEIPAGKSSEEVIGAAITAGNAPCLVFNTSPAAVPGFEKQGGLVDLSKFKDGESYITERSGKIADQYRSPDGDFYQLPWKSNPVMIFYNKDLFQQAGLDPENPALSTYEDFLATSRTLVDAGV